MVIEKFLGSFLNHYDRSRLLGIVFGLAILIPITLMFTWALASLAHFGLPEVVILFVAAGISIPLFRPFYWVLVLMSEAIWWTFGIYRLFGISGQPLRDELAFKLERRR